MSQKSTHFYKYNEIHCEMRGGNGIFKKEIYNENLNVLYLPKNHKNIVIHISQGSF